MCSKRGKIEAVFSKTNMNNELPNSLDRLAFNTRVSKKYCSILVYPSLQVIYRVAEAVLAIKGTHHCWKFEHCHIVHCFTPCVIYITFIIYIIYIIYIVLCN